MRRSVSTNIPFMQALEAPGLRDKTAQPEKPPPFDKQTALVKAVKGSEHQVAGSWWSLRFAPENVTCTRCGPAASKRRLFDWLVSPCIPVVDANNLQGTLRARAKAPGTQESGLARVHHSHGIILVKSTQLCTHCAAYTTSTDGKKSSLRLLGKPCKDHARFGRQVLQRQKKGLPPGRNMGAWPFGRPSCVSTAPPGRRW